MRTRGEIRRGDILNCYYNNQRYVARRKYLDGNSEFLALLTLKGSFGNQIILDISYEDYNVVKF